MPIEFREIWRTVPEPARTRLSISCQPWLTFIGGAPSPCRRGTGEGHLADAIQGVWTGTAVQKLVNLNSGEPTPYRQLALPTKEPARLGCPSDSVEAAAIILGDKLVQRVMKRPDLDVAAAMLRHVFIATIAFALTGDERTARYGGLLSAMQGGIPVGQAPGNHGLIYVVCV